MGRGLRGGAESGRGPVMASRCPAGATPLATGKETLARSPGARRPQTRTLGGTSGGTAGILWAHFLLPLLAV